MELGGSRQSRMRFRGGMLDCLGLAAHVELKDSGHHDNCLRSISILEHRKFHGFGAIDEQAATKTLLILRDPISPAVSADAKQSRR